MEPVRLPVIVLAGGKSTRLGRDKASEVLAGRSLLQRALDACRDVASRIIVVKAKGQNLPEIATPLPIDDVDDTFPEIGPLGGIYTGLALLDEIPSHPERAKRGEVLRALVVACDMPLLQPALLHEFVRLSPGRDAVVPIRDGFPEPLCAVYSTACTGHARQLIERGAYKTAGLLDRIDPLLIPEPQWRPFDPDARSFLNVNREEDLEYVRALIGA